MNELWRHRDAVVMSSAGSWFAKIGHECIGRGFAGDDEALRKGRRCIELYALERVKELRAIAAEACDRGYPDTLALIEARPGDFEGGKWQPDPSLTEFSNSLKPGLSAVQVEYLRTLDEVSDKPFGSGIWAPKTYPAWLADELRALAILKRFRASLHGKAKLLWCSDMQPDDELDRFAKAWVGSSYHHPKPLIIAVDLVGFRSLATFRAWPELELQGWKRAKK